MTPERSADPPRQVVRLADKLESFAVPVGVEHQPFADVETHLLQIEPSGTPNTGDREIAAQRNVI